MAETPMQSIVDWREFREFAGHGSIEGLSRLAGGRNEVRGEFGVVVLDAERPILRLKGP